MSTEWCVDVVGVERDHLKSPGIDGRIIIRWIFRKWDVQVWSVSFACEGENNKDR
jgi:hypothetical protein